jgi:hypothetical protein
MFGRMPTSALLERVAAHIDRLDQTLKETEDLLLSLERRDRDDWIRQVHQRLTATPSTNAVGEVPEQPSRPYYRS